SASKIQIQDFRGNQETPMGRVRIWDPATLVTLQSLPVKGPVSTIVWSADGSLVATASSPAKNQAAQRASTWDISVWEAATGKQIRSIAVERAREPNSAAPLHLAISPDNQWLAVERDSDVGIFALSTGQQAMSIARGQGPLAWQRDCRQLA